MFEKDDDGAARIWRNGALQLMRQSGDHADNAAAWAKNAREWKAHALGLTDENANLKAQLAAAQLALLVKPCDPDEAPEIAPVACGAALPL